jgi:hypothetical protein
MLVKSRCWASELRATFQYMRTQRFAYEAPRAIVMGSASGLVRGNADGNFLDQDFPDGTPKPDLTFSG